MGFVIYGAFFVGGLLAALALRQIAALVLAAVVLGAVVFVTAALAGVFDDWYDGGAWFGLIFVAMVVVSWSLGAIVGGLIRRRSHGQPQRT